MNYNIGNEMMNEKAAAAYLRGADANMRRAGDAGKAEAARTAGTNSFGKGYALELGSADRDGQILGDKKKNTMGMLQEDLTSDAKAQKDFMILASNTMSPEAYGKLAEDGYDVQQMDPEETVTVVDEIKAEMAKAGVVIAGYNDDLTTEELEAMTGSAAYAAELGRAFRENGVPLNEENIKDAAAVLEKAEQIPALSDGAKQYLEENELQPTVNNLYLAAHSGAAAAAARQGYVQTGGYLGKTAAGEVPMDEKLTGQMEKVIERAGAEVTEETLAEAKRILDLGMPLTEDTFSAMSELDALRFPLQMNEVADAAARALADGQPAGMADVTKDKTMLQEAVELAQTVSEISDAAVDAAVDADAPLTIQSLAAQQKYLDARQTQMQLRVEVSYEARRMSAHRQMEEVRLSMTVEVSYRMLKNGVHVDTTELSRLVDEMKAAEQQMQAAKFGSSGAQTAADRAALFTDTVNTLRQLPGMPVSLVGQLVQGKDSVTIGAQAALDITLSEYAALGNRRIQHYAAANERYETMMTVPRADLGDNIKAAFERADSLLAELGIEASEENLRATRILGYNSMELSEENMTAVKAAYRKVRHVTERMTPAATLQMIREGINPMELSMEELDKRLAETPESAEKYSEYLVRMEQKGDVTPQERASFIGIYRMLHQVGKRDGAAIGSVVAQGAELSFSNLLSAVRSRRDSGMDVSVDDSFGGMQSAVQNDIEEQIRTAYYRSAVQEMNAAGHVPTEVYEEILGSGLAATPDLVLGLDGLRRERGMVFDAARAALKGIGHRRQHTSADGEVSTEDGASAGTSAFAVTESILEAAIEDTLENFVSAEDAGTAYEHMADVAAQVMAEAALQEGETIDVRRFTSAMKQIGTARALAREETYELPMVLGGEQSSVSVRIVRGSAERGMVDIAMEHAPFGRLRARFTAEQAGGEQRLSGYVVCDTAEGMAAAEAQREQFFMRLAEQQIPMGEINFVHSERMSVNFSADRADELNSGFDTGSLYRTAKTFLQVLGGAGE
ncbi:MAG: hypothetical protein IJ600_00275 [Lachnospiraceae bacterium]|nr:hypothetical protein [Lachnospiraceae bacterium]